MMFEEYTYLKNITEDNLIQKSIKCAKESQNWKALITSVTESSDINGQRL